MSVACAVVVVCACAVAWVSVIFGALTRRRMRRRYEAMIDADERLIRSLMALIESQQQQPQPEGWHRINGERPH